MRPTPLVLLDGCLYEDGGSGCMKDLLPKPFFPATRLTRLSSTLRSSCTITTSQLLIYVLNINLATEAEAAMEVPSRQKISQETSESIETGPQFDPQPASSASEMVVDIAPDGTLQPVQKPAKPPLLNAIDSAQEASTSRWTVPTQPIRRESPSDMRPPPAKRRRIHNYDRRPRLSICPSVSPDAELVEDRDRNDNTLKGKFEAIFEKYGRDFSGIGDEIHVMTGEVLVDNGHILSMDHETDPGSPSRARPTVYREGTVQSVTPMRQNGRSLTVGAEDVIASIEAMAQRVATGETLYLEEDYEEEWYESDDEMQPYQRSGSVSSDSLFGEDYQSDGGSQRSVRQDSLLGLEEHNSSIESFSDEQSMLTPKEAPMMRNSNSGSVEEPIFLNSGPLSAPASDPFSKVPSYHGQYHGHPPPAKTKPKSASPPPFVKSNGKQKIVAKKFNVSKAFEELQRSGSITPLPMQGVTKAATPKFKPSKGAPQPKAKPKSPPRQARMGAVVSEQREILKRLPVPRISSEPRAFEGDYESDDPLAF